jgi:hypothetical protein
MATLIGIFTHSAVAMASMRGVENRILVETSPRIASNLIPAGRPSTGTAHPLRIVLNLVSVHNVGYQRRLRS